MRLQSIIFLAAVSAGTWSVAGCQSEAEDIAEERVEAEAEARGEEGLHSDLRELGAGEIAEFEEEQKSGEHMGHRVYGETPRTAEEAGEEPLKEAIFDD